MPIIGYAFDLENPALEIKWIGSPHEILEELRDRGLTFSGIADHRATVIKAAKIAKESPELTFSGGPYAESIIDFLEVIERKDLVAAESILNQNREFFSGNDDAVAIPLLAAVESNAVDVVRLLALKMIGLDHETQFGMTALHWAAALGESEIAGILLEAGADSSRRNWFYFSPGELATLNGHKDTERVIAKHGGQTGEISKQQMLLRMRHKKLR